MSLIDQALKKTQSSLNKQKTESLRSPIYSAATAQIPLTTQRLINPTGRKNTANTFFEFPAMNKYWIIGPLLAIFVAAIGFETHLHFASVKAHYANFYGKIATDFLSKSKKAALVIASQPLTLDGTMEMNSARVALINGKLYHTGQTVNGYQIQQIHYNGVTLQNTATHQTNELTPELTD